MQTSKPLAWLEWARALSAPGGISTIVGHTGLEPVKLPFSVGYTAPVLGGLCVNFASNKTT